MDNKHSVLLQGLILLRPILGTLGAGSSLSTNSFAVLSNNSISSETYLKALNKASAKSNGTAGVYVQALLTAARAIAALLFLFYASWSDHKTREVSNTVWIVFAPVAFTLTFLDIYMSESSALFSFGISFGLTAAFSIMLFYAGGFGGADAKALMCLALALPFFPSNLITPVSGEDSVILKTFFPITVFSNAVLFAAATAIYMFFRNMFWRVRTGNKLFEGGQEEESLGKRILVLLTGYKMPIGKVKEKWHLYPLEDAVEEAEGNFRRKLVLIPSDENRSAVIERLEKAIKSGSMQDRILATPGLPMLIFVTAGLITALIFGDIVWTCVRLLLG